MSKPFQAGTYDFVEDAVTSLMASGDSYILFVIRDTKTLAETFLTDEDKAMLRTWLDTGHWNDLLACKLPPAP
jgi:hypothetical protein